MALIPPGLWRYQAALVRYFPLDPYLRHVQSHSVRFLGSAEGRGIQGMGEVEFLPPENVGEGDLEKISFNSYQLRRHRWRT